MVSWRLPRTILVPGRKVGNLTPADLGFEYEDIELTTSDGHTLAAFYVPADRAHANLIVLHGNSGNKEGYLEFVTELVPAGYNLLLVDQRAHGHSSGHYHTFGAREWRDLEAANFFLIAENSLPTGVFAHSMGGAVALRALSTGPDGKQQVAGLDFAIIQSSFADFTEITHAFARRMSGLPLPTSFTQMVLGQAGRLADFDPRSIVPERLAAGVRVPVLVIHGSDDARIPLSHGRRLYEALGSERKTWLAVPGAGHDDVTEAGGAHYWKTVREFLDSLN